MIHINDPVEVLLTRKGCHILNDWEQTLALQFDHKPQTHQRDTWYPTTYWVCQKIFSHHFNYNHEPPYTQIRPIPRSTNQQPQPNELVAD